MADGFTYHGIEKLALISEAISGMFECTRDQLDNFRQLKPDTLDDATLCRVKNLYENEAELYPYFTRQLIRWTNLDLTKNQELEKKATSKAESMLASLEARFAKDIQEDPPKLYEQHKNTIEERIKRLKATLDPDKSLFQKWMAEISDYFSEKTATDKPNIPDWDTFYLENQSNIGSIDDQRQAALKIAYNSKLNQL